MLLNCGVGEDLRVPWTARRSNQSILKEINAEYSLEGLILKLKLQYFGLLMWKADSLEKPLLLGKIEGGRRKVWQRWDGWMASLTQWTWVWANSGKYWRTGKLGVLHAVHGLQRGCDLVTEQQQKINDGKDNVLCVPIFLFFFFRKFSSARVWVASDGFF